MSSARLPIPIDTAPLQLDMPTRTGLQRVQGLKSRILGCTSGPFVWHRKSTGSFPLILAYNRFPTISLPRHWIDTMAANKFIDVRLRVIAIDERNGRRVVRTDDLPKELQPYVQEVEMKRTTEPNVEVYLFYEPFLGLVDALEGENVPFRLDLDQLKLWYAPTADVYMGEPSVTLNFAPSLVHRFYKLNKRKSEATLYWCVGLTTDKKKQKAILLDVAKLCTSTLPLDQVPSQTVWPGTELYSMTKLSKLMVAIPCRANLSRPVSPSLSSESLSTDDDSPRSNSSLGKRKQLATRLKVKLQEYEDEMVNITTSGLSTV